LQPERFPTERSHGNQADKAKPKGEEQMTEHKLILCRSDTGDGGWSLHPPGSTDEQIASGDAPYLLSGDSKKNKFGRWSRPNAKDYRMALKGLDG
jgi:hypothetical protein